MAMSLFVRDLARNKGQFHPALQPRFVEWRIAATRMQRGGIKNIGLVGIEPDEIGRSVSSGCIRMRDLDVIDLYSRVHVGTKIVVK